MEILWLFIGLIAGAAGVFGFLKFTASNLVNQARTEAEQLKKNAVLEAETKAKEIELAAQQKQLTVKEKLEQEQTVIRRKLEEHESRLDKRESTVDKKLDTLSVLERKLDERNAKLDKIEKSVADRDAELGRLLAEERERLLAITQMTPEQAKTMLLGRVENEMRGEVGKIVQRFVAQAEEEG